MTAPGSSGFEGAAALEALLAQAGKPKRMPEVDALLRAGLSEDLRPSEVVARVLGKEGRALPPELAWRLAQNLFSLYEAIGREQLSETLSALRRRAGQLSEEARGAWRGFSSRPLDRASGEAHRRLGEAVEALSALERDLARLPPTRRLCADAEGALSYLSELVRGAISVLAG
jgi:hypothetical protein